MPVKRRKATDRSSSDHCYSRRIRGRLLPAHMLRQSWDADVIVVGAGPAGSSAAAHLARRGHRVLLLERASFPRDKVCGDVLLPSLQKPLSAIGTSLDILAGDAATIHGCGFTTATNIHATGTFRDRQGNHQPWRILPRVLFDERLARHAEGCGADLRERHSVEEVTWDQQKQVNIVKVRNRSNVNNYHAPLVIAANGAFSRFGQRSGLHQPRNSNRGYSVALRTYVQYPKQERIFEVFADADLKRGCCWLVPGPHGMANVGIGTFDSPNRPTRTNLESIFRKRIGQRVNLDGCAPMAGWLLPGPRLTRRTVTDGLLLVGDAAGFVDPFTGHGIHTAVSSGLLASTASHHALLSGMFLHHQMPLRSYEKAWRKAFGLDFVLGRLFQRLHHDQRLLDKIMLHAAHNHLWADEVMSIIGHALPRSNVMRPGLFSRIIRSQLSNRGADQQRMSGPAG